MPNKRINNRDYLNLNETCYHLINEQQAGGGDGGDGGAGGDGGIMPALKRSWEDLKPMWDDFVNQRPPCTTPGCLIIRCMENPPCDWEALFKRIGGGAPHQYMY